MGPLPMPPAPELMCGSFAVKPGRASSPLASAGAPDRELPALAPGQASQVPTPKGESSVNPRNSGQGGLVGQIIDP